MTITQPGECGIESNYSTHCAHPQTRSSRPETVPARIPRCEVYQPPLRSHRRSAQPHRNRAQDNVASAGWVVQSSSATQVYSPLRIGKSAPSLRRDCASQRAGARGSRTCHPLAFLPDNGDTDKRRQSICAVQPFAHRSPDRWTGSGQRCRLAGLKNEYPSNVSFLGTFEGLVRCADPNPAGKPE